MVATPTAAGVPGVVWQQWMCAATVFVVKPENDAATSSVWASVFSTTVAVPDPSEGVPSFAPLRTARKVVVAASAAGTDHIRVAQLKPIAETRTRTCMATAQKSPQPHLLDLTERGKRPASH